jgi:hypothetical protein
VIFSFYRRLAVKLGEERYEFDRSSLMFTEVVEIENATGLAYGEWQAELGRYSIRAIAGLLHVLRQRAGVPSDFETLNFAADDLDVVPLKDDGTEMTAGEVAEDIARRIGEARKPGPTGAAVSAASGENQQPVTTVSTSPSSPATTESAPGNGSISPGQTSIFSAATPTPG